MVKIKVIVTIIGSFLHMMLLWQFKAVGIVCFQPAVPETQMLEERFDWNKHLFSFLISLIISILHASDISKCLLPCLFAYCPSQSHQDLAEQRHFGLEIDLCFELIIIHVII